MYGFLPQMDPLQMLAEPFDAWEAVAGYLPKLLLTDQLRVVLAELPEFPVAELQNERQLERAMLILSFLGHAYVWGADPVAHEIPETIAVPWYQVAQQLQRPPVLSYASYALNNWRRINPDGAVMLGNIALLQNFLGGIDEEWFVLVHVEIETQAAPLINNLVAAQTAVSDDNVDALISALQNSARALTAICNTLDRMPEHCDPYIYFNRVRPYIHGWKDHPLLPNGMIYQGVKEYGGKPQFFRGETGAQSGIIPSVDAVLGIQHKNDQLSRYLAEMPTYMPYKHREFLFALQKKPAVRDYIVNTAKQNSELKDAYNHCIELVTRFRTTHLKFAASYIQQQSQTSTANPTATGTGGTPFMDYLRKHKEECLAFQIN